MSYLQVLLLERRSSTFRRLHLRFCAGDNSYSYFRENIFCTYGFSDKSSISTMGESLRAHFARMPEEFRVSTLAECQLRPIDSSVFVQSILEGKGAPDRLTDTPAPYALSVAFSTPEDEPRLARFDGEGPADLPGEVRALVDYCFGVGERDLAARGPAIDPSGDLPAPAPPKPWWKFW